VNQPVQIGILNDGDELTVRISKYGPKETAEKIAGYFYHFSTDEETTAIMEGPDGGYTVEMTCNDDTHDLAVVRPFTPENVAKALKEADYGYDHNLCEAGVLLDA